MPTDPKIVPLEVKAPHGARVMEIRWADGHRSVLPHDTLRGYCPCAHCQGHSGTIKYVPGGDQDLRNIVVAKTDGGPVYLKQVATVEFAPKVKRGDSGYMAKPAVVVSIEKQPSVDTVALTRELEAAVADLNANLPLGIKADQIIFRQANFTFLVP